jgi:hypothetical protein
MGTEKRALGIKTTDDAKQLLDHVGDHVLGLTMDNIVALGFRENCKTPRFVDLCRQIQYTYPPSLSSVIIEEVERARAQFKASIDADRHRNGATPAPAVTSNAGPAPAVAPNAAVADAVVTVDDEADDSWVQCTDSESESASDADGAVDVEAYVDVEAGPAAGGNPDGDSESGNGIDYERAHSCIFMQSLIGHEPEKE